MTNVMKRFMLATVVLSALGAPSLILISPAHAACSDVPAPEVYWRRCVFDRQDLADLDLTGASLRDTSFKRADLTASILENVDARRAKFVSSVMENVVLDAANLVRADLTKAVLRGASLKGADLTSARMFRADLRGADLTDAHLENADLLQAQLDGATWTDGKTVCAEGSVGRCQRSRDGSTPAAVPEVKDSEPPA